MRNSSESSREHGLAGRSAQERLYRIGVGIKGFDGALELVMGMLLLFAPAAIVGVLSPAASVDADDGALRVLVAHWAGQAILTLSAHAPASFILFLLAHGAIKLALVFCLLREYRWVYPYAFSALGLFTIYQLFVVLTQFSAFALVFTVLDIAIVAVVWREWRMLVTGSKPRPGGSVPSRPHRSDKAVEKTVPSSARPDATSSGSE